MVVALVAAVPCMVCHRSAGWHSRLCALEIASAFSTCQAALIAGRRLSSPQLCLASMALITESTLSQINLAHHEVAYIMCVLSFVLSKLSCPVQVDEVMT